MSRRALPSHTSGLSSTTHYASVCIYCQRAIGSVLLLLVPDHAVPKTVKPRFDEIIRLIDFRFEDWAAAWEAGSSSTTATRGLAWIPTERASANAPPGNPAGYGQLPGQEISPRLY